MIYRPPISALNIAHARRALQLCGLCYQDNTKRLDKSLAVVSASLIRPYKVKDSEAFLIYADGLLWIVYQGSDDKTDWKRNAAYCKVDFPGGGRVHRGFFEAFSLLDSAIYSDLKDFPKLEKIGAGHSLGATCMQQAMVTYRLNGGYAFGSPRVGDADFCGRITAPLFRFEHLTDPACYVPPRTSPLQLIGELVDLKKPTLYDRAGTAILVRGNLHRIVHYASSVSIWLSTLEIERRLAAARKS